MKKYLTNMTHSALLIFVSTLAAPTFADNDIVAGRMIDLAQNLGAIDQEDNTNKRNLVEKYMKLTDVEAKAFWPVYNAYQDDLQKIIKQLSIAIDVYAQAYSKGALSNETAEQLLNKALAIELAEVKLKQSYIPKLKKVLPIVKVARYIQFETKIQAVVYFSLADKIPLVE